MKRERALFDEIIFPNGKSKAFTMSIETQRAILQQYAQDNGLHVVDEYVDDGWSGTNFERPDFRRMMKDIELGKVNCVVTKNLSRFGREHIMMDYYLEFIFPEKRVRYIAVAENEDTEKVLSDFVPFKNLFNEWFAKDTSRKVKDALRTKFKNKERVCAYAILGYKKDPSAKNRIIPDEETRWIVEKIYETAYYGAGAAKITRILTEEKVPTPSWLNYQRYGNFANIYKNAPESKKYAWTIAQVKSILKDETYIGNTIHYRETNILYKNKKRIRKPQEQSLRVEGTHEALISRDVFDRVQDLSAKRRRSQKNAVTQIFAGLVRCADCGWSMRFATNRQNKTPYSYYSCTYYSQHGRGWCSSHYIRYDVLYAYVLSRLQYWCRQAQIDRKRLLEKVKDNVGGECTAQTKAKLTELNRLEKRRSDVDSLFTRMYEDRAADRITERNFTMLLEKYQAEQQQLEIRIQDLKAELSLQKQAANNAEKWLAIVEKYATPTELTAELLNALIDKILVHEAEVGPDGIRQQEVEIFYRFIGRLDGQSLSRSSIPGPVSLPV